MSSTILDQVLVRLYLGNDKDETISRHLSQFDDAPRGAKPDEMKRLAHLGLRTMQEERTILDRDAIRDAVREALGETQPALKAIRDVVGEIGIKGSSVSFDLSDIRKVVNAALEEHLGRLELSTVAKPKGGSTDDDEDQELEEMMQKLDASLANFGGGIS